jgi:hypothetical protein
MYDINNVFQFILEGDFLSENIKRFDNYQWIIYENENGDIINKFRRFRTNIEEGGIEYKNITGLNKITQMIVQDLYDGFMEEKHVRLMSVTEKDKNFFYYTYTTHKQFLPKIANKFIATLILYCMEKANFPVEQALFGIDVLNVLNDNTPFLTSSELILESFMYENKLNINQPNPDFSKILEELTLYDFLKEKFHSTILKTNVNTMVPLLKYKFSDDEDTRLVNNSLYERQLMGPISQYIKYDFKNIHIPVFDYFKITSLLGMDFLYPNLYIYLLFLLIYSHVFLLEHLFVL